MAVNSLSQGNTLSGPGQTMVNSMDTAPVPRRVRGHVLSLLILWLWGPGTQAPNPCLLQALGQGDRGLGGSPASECELEAEGPHTYLLVLA